MSPTKSKHGSETETVCTGRLSEDSAEDSIFKEWEATKTALLAPDRTVHAGTKRKKRKRKISSSSSEGEPSEKKPTVSRKSVNNAIRLLSRDKPKPSTAESRMQKYCRGELSYTTSFDSPTCMLAAIRRCVLTRNWRRLVDLLLIFVRVNENVMYRKYVKEVGVVCKVLQWGLLGLFCF